MLEQGVFKLGDAARSTRSHSNAGDTADADASSSRVS